MSKDKVDPLISELTADYLVSAVNRTAASVDVTAFSPQEAFAIYMLLDRLMDVLWHEQGQALLSLFRKLSSHLSKVDLSDQYDAHSPANENYDADDDYEEDDDYEDEDGYYEHDYNDEDKEDDDGDDSL